MSEATPNPKRPGPVWRKVYSPRNSSCGVDLDKLDWLNWWTDSLNGVHYLKVKEPGQGTVQRVYCKHANAPRVGVRSGTLCWLIDSPKTVSGSYEEGAE